MSEEIFEFMAVVTGARLCANKAKINERKRVGPREKCSLLNTAKAAEIDKCKSTAVGCYTYHCSFSERFRKNTGTRTEKFLGNSRRRQIGVQTQTRHFII